MLLAFGLFSGGLFCQAEQPASFPRESVRPIAGALVIAGGGTLPAEIVDRFLQLGGGPEARLAVVTTASMYAGTDEMDARMTFWREKRPAQFHVVHTRSRDEANDPAFAPELDQATAVWFIGGNQNWLTEAYLGTLAERRFHDVIRRGGVIGGTSAGAAIMSRVMIAGGRETPRLATGFGFAPGLIVDQHFRKRNRQARLIEALRAQPGRIGVGIDEGTALVIHGTTAEVVGVSDVTSTLAEGAGRSSRTESLVPGKSADLAVLSRAAMTRLPTESPIRPEVRNGTLVLVGEGAAPEEVGRQFLEAAGGKDAPIVVVCTLPESADDENEICRWLRSAGASNVTALPVRSRHDVESEEFLAQVSQAQGIWLSSGPIRQLIDTYVDTPAHALLKKLLERGGVLAGSAESAYLSSAALPSSAESDELELMAEAYERGLGFLPGVALSLGVEDASPSPNLAGLKTRYPQLIGVELTDSTALVVRGSKMQVIGKHPIRVLDRMPDDAEDHPEFLNIQPGEFYDLCDRTRLVIGPAEAGDQ
jgi:cyanophycinase